MCTFFPHIFIPSFSRGGTRYKVHGQNMDVVLEPRLILYREGVVSEGMATRRKRQDGVEDEEFVSEVCFYTCVPCGHLVVIPLFILASAFLRGFLPSVYKVFRSCLTLTQWVVLVQPPAVK